MKPVKTVDPCRIVATNVRLAYTKQLFVRGKKYKDSLPTEPLVYSVTLLLPPTTDLKPYVDAMRAAMVKDFRKIKNIEGRCNPIRRCDGSSNKGYANGWFHINVRNEAQPPVVNALRLPITDPTKVWAGQWANVVLDAYGWRDEGVSFSLQAVQIIRDGADTDPDGPRIDGRGKRVDPNEVFEALEMPPEVGGDTGDDLFAGLKF
jgi:hypothetical protein